MTSLMAALAQPDSVDDRERTLILGMGNSLLSDDGVGLYVAAELKNRINRPEITIIETSAAGLYLLDLLLGYHKAIIIDAIQTPGGKPGDIYRLDPESFNATNHLASPHEVDFTTAIDFGKRVGLPLPKEIVVFGIEALDTTTFNEDCTPAVKRAIPICVELVLQEISEKGPIT